MTFEESMDIMRRALTLWQQAGDNPSERQYYDFVSLVKVAIGKAGEPVAGFHSILAAVHFDMNNFPAAWEEAEKTLTIDADDFKAQWIKSMIAFAIYAESMDQAQSKKMGFMDTIGALVNMTKGYRQGQETGRKIGEAIGSKRNANQAKTLFVQEIANLATLFKRICSQGIEASNFIESSRRLIKMADGLSEFGIPLEGDMNLYALVANISISKIAYETDEEKDEVQTTQLIAQGRMSL